MAKKLKVLTPQTSDGVNLKYDDKKQPVIKETIAELGARKGLESLNAKLPPQLKATFEEIEVEDAPTGASNAELKKKLEGLEARRENMELIDRIAYLESQLEAKETAAASIPPPPPAIGGLDTGNIPGKIGGPVTGTDTNASSTAGTTGEGGKTESKKAGSKSE